jgi:hypothetical protein
MKFWRANRQDQLTFRRAHKTQFANAVRPTDVCHFASLLEWAGKMIKYQERPQCEAGVQSQVGIKQQNGAVASYAANHIE